MWPRSPEGAPGGRLSLLWAWGGCWWRCPASIRPAVPTYAGGRGCGSYSGSGWVNSWCGGEFRGENAAAWWCVDNFVPWYGASDALQWSWAERSHHLPWVLRLLHERGILSFSKRCRGRVGAFTVSKKSKIVDGIVRKRQRLVLDCRQVNMLFRPSPHTELGSLSSLADIALGPSQQLFMSGADIQDCFYAVHLPSEMMSFFCLESDISGHEAAWVSNGACSGGDEHWSPCINVLPMGFSWSFYLVQHIHQASVLRSLSISEDQLFLDGRPPPRLEKDKLYSMPYCDNIHCLALDREQCNFGKQQIVEDLSHQGFSIHEDEEANTFFQTLGGQLDGDKGRVSMTSRRAWDLIYAFRFVADNVVSPSVMQKLLGHAMFFSTINRAGMSVFRRLYDFVERADGPRLLSKSEREECLIFSGLIPLLFADLRKQWSETVHCTDASPDGYGVCTRSLDAKHVESMGRWNERWRFRRLEPDEWGPRRRALGLDPFSDGDTVLGTGAMFDEIDEMGTNENFPEIPFEVTHPSHWKTVLMGKWRQDGAITAKEGRALALAVRRLSRSSESRGHKHLFLVDSFSLALSIHKGRAKSFDLLRVNQQIAALSLASGFSIRVRWIASELNVADGPSRGQIDPGSYRGLETSSGGKNNRCQSGFEEETCGEKGQAGSEWNGNFKRSLFTIVEGQGDTSHESGTLEEEGGEGSSSSGRGRGISCSEEETDSFRRTANFHRGSQPVSSVLSTVREFLPGQRIGLAMTRDVDIILADFLDVMFLENHSAADGEKVVAATEFFNLHLKGALSHCRRALRGWRKEKPPQSRLPLPRLIAAGMAMVLCSRGKRLMALKLMVDHDTYLRPGESIDLKGWDIVPPVRNTGKQYRWYAIVVRDAQDLRPDKTGVFDNSIPLNSPGREYLGQLLWERAKKLNQVVDTIYPFEASDYRKSFQEAGTLLGVKNLHPYQTRHGGASEDLNSGERDHQAVKVRGRWHTDQSVRRYGKVGKVQKLMAELSPEHMAYCQWSLKNIQKVLQGTLPARVP